MIYARNLQWLNHNTQRKFPLTAEATATDTTGNFQIPDDFLVSLYLTVPTALSVSPAGFYVMKIGAYATGYSVVIGYNGEPVASALIARAAHSYNTPYRLVGLGNFVDCTGVLVVATLDSIDGQPAGQWSFDEAAGRLETDCIRPNIRGITSLRCQNSGDISEPVYGDVILQAGNNMRITVDLTGPDPVIRLDAISGEGLNEPCACSGDNSPPIYRINGIGPTPDGDFTLLGNDCLEPEAIANGIRLNDICSSPCCGCPELTTIVDALQTLRNQIANIESFTSALEGRASALDSAVFGSTLGEGGCQKC